MPSLVDAEALARLSTLHLRARGLAKGLRLGLHRSRRLGTAVEFADWEVYRPGLDARRIDWRVWARTDRLLVRRSHEETDLPVLVVLDASADLASGPQVPSPGRPDLAQGKAGAAIVLAATLMVAAWDGGEPVGLELIAGKVERRRFPPRRGQNGLAMSLGSLASVVPAGRAGLGEQLVSVASRAPHKAVVFLLTDGMEPLHDWLPALRGFAARGVDLRVLHLRDEAELRLDGVGVTWLVSPETGEERVVDADVVRVGLRLARDRHDSSVRDAVHALGGLWWAVDTGAPLPPVVARALLGRRDETWI